MTFYDFEANERLNEVKNRHSEIITLKNKLADYRSKFRGFCDYITLEKEILFHCIAVYEQTLLIDCFTYSEQLNKAVIYKLLDKGNNHVCVERFINDKIHPQKFSPNIEIRKIEESFGKILGYFKFIINDIPEIDKYNELIKSRHRYAHSGIYDFDFNNFKDVIKILEYITFDYGLIFKVEFDREFYIKRFNKFEDKLNKLLKERKRPDFNELLDKIKTEFHDDIYLTYLKSNHFINEKFDEIIYKLN